MFRWIWISAPIFTSFRMKFWHESCIDISEGCKTGDLLLFVFFSEISTPYSCKKITRNLAKMAAKIQIDCPGILLAGPASVGSFFRYSIFTKQNFLVGNRSSSCIACACDGWAYTTHNIVLCDMRYAAKIFKWKHSGPAIKRTRSVMHEVFKNCHVCQ